MKKILKKVEIKKSLRQKPLRMVVKALGENQQIIELKAQFDQSVRNLKLIEAMATVASILSWLLTDRLISVVLHSNLLRSIQRPFAGTVVTVDIIYILGIGIITLMFNYLNLILLTCQVTMNIINIVKYNRNNKRPSEELMVQAQIIQITSWLIGVQLGIFLRQHVEIYLQFISILVMYIIFIIQIHDISKERRSLEEKYLIETGQKQRLIERQP